jgi:hypothetical protein
MKRKNFLIVEASREISTGDKSKGINPRESPEREEASLPVVMCARVEQNGGSIFALKV